MNMKLCSCGCGKQTSIAKLTNKKYGHVAGVAQRFMTGHYIRKTPSVAKRIQHKSVPNRETGCIEWTGAFVPPSGYGVICVEKVQQYVHRALWAEINGPIPAGMFVCHKCDNPKCANINHLFLGTPLDNTRDMIAKGRARFGGARI